MLAGSAEQLEWPQSPDFELHQSGDGAILLRLRLPASVASFKELELSVRTAVLQLLRGLARQLETEWPESWLGQVETVASYDSLLLVLDESLSATNLPSIQTWLIEEIARYLTNWQQDGPRLSPAGRLHRIGVLYDGPDLEMLADLNGLSVTALIEWHTSQTYEVQIIGFAPGFAYLGDLPPGFQANRRSQPRTAVPAGSVAVAAGMTAIYPFKLPGGWNILGTTAFKLFDITQNPPVRFVPGDQVQFYLINDAHEADPDEEGWL